MEYRLWQKSPLSSSFKLRLIFPVRKEASVLQVPVFCVCWAVDLLCHLIGAVFRTQRKIRVWEFRLVVFPLWKCFKTSFHWISSACVCVYLIVCVEGFIMLSCCFSLLGTPFLYKSWKADIIVNMSHCHCRQELTCSETRYLQDGET